MAKINWTDDLNTGIDEIDQQHRAIVDYVNELDTARKTQDKEKVAKIIDDTVDYTLSHFGFEETMMEEAGYALLRPHKRVHELFVRRVADLQERFKKGEDVSEELHSLLSRWLVRHIKHDDYAYAETVKKHLNIAPPPPKKPFWNRIFGL